MLECTGYFVRTYANQRTGESVSVLRDRRPHRADRRAYTRDLLSPAATTQNHERARADCDTGRQGQEDRFWALSFKTNSARRTCSASIMHGAPATAGRPRTMPASHLPAGRISTRSRSPATLPAGTDLKTGDTCEKFLKDFVPVLRQYLIEPSPG